MPGSTGLIVALDTGSTGDPLNRSTEVMEDWSVEKTLRMGASGVKLLLYYHPDSPQAGQREQVQAVMLKAYRWQYIVSGVQEPRFSNLLSELTTAEQGERIGNALAPILN